MTEKYGALNSHIVDNFFLVGPADSNECSADLSTFMSICSAI